jgi:aminomethyltransferase
VPADPTLQTTALDSLHRDLGAKMVPFAGYDMPVQYPTGVLTEHNWTRARAGLFDVSHMGQVRLVGAGAAAGLERLVPGDIVGLKPQRTRYTLFTNDAGGILDDLMVTNAGDHLFLVVNAACKQADIAHLQKHLANDCKVEPLPDRALLALQGPEAASVMAVHCPDAVRLGFMQFSPVTVAGLPCWITRSGYTGEDGFEISVAAADAEKLARTLLGDSRVKPIGLGARDSLRLEAGLCLYGHDIDETTTPIEADLAWTIQKRRREGGGFPGADKILQQLAQGAPRKRVGLKPDGKAPAREHTQVTNAAGAAIGEVTSGGFGPTVGGPVAMGYLAAAHAAPGTAVQLIVRDQPRPAVVAAMPFTPHRYHRA